MACDLEYYRALNVPKTASDAEIKKAYRGLALRWHPDKNPDHREVAEKRFKEISEAYAILSDPEKKNLYDRFGKAGLDSSGGSSAGASDHHRFFQHFMRSQFNPHPHSHSRGGSFHDEEAFGEDFFADFLGGGFDGFPGPRRGGCGGGPRRTREPERPTTPRSSPDTPVFLHSLVSAAKFNHMTAKIISFDEFNGRYKVRLDDTEEEISVKAGNFSQLIKLVKIGKILDRPEISDQTGTIVNFNPQTNRYGVKLRSGNFLSLEISQFIIPQGTCAFISGLENSPQFNDQACFVGQYEAGRYTVEIGEGRGVGVTSGRKTIRVKPGNLKL